MHWLRRAARQAAECRGLPHVLQPTSPGACGIALQQTGGAEHRRNAVLHVARKPSGERPRVGHACRRRSCWPVLVRPLKILFHLFVGGARDSAVAALRPSSEHAGMTTMPNSWTAQSGGRTRDASTSARAVMARAVLKPLPDRCASSHFSVLSPSRS